MSRGAGARASSRSAAPASPARRRAARWIVAKCCSASVSVGAISAAWRPCSTARSIAYSATTVLPLPTSPISSRCIGRGSARSSSICSIARCWSPVSANGSACSQPARGQRRRLGEGDRAARGRAAAARRRRNSSCIEQQLLEGEPAAAALGVARRRAGSASPPARRRGRAGARPRARRAGRVSTTSASAARSALHEREDLRRGDALGGRVVRDRLGRAGALARRLADARLRRCVVGDAEAAAAVGLAVQQQPRARRVALDEPGLVEERRAHRAGRVEHRRPRPAGACRGGAPGARRSLRTSTATVACSPGPQRRDRARLAAVARAGARAGRRRSRSPSVRRPAAARLPGALQRRVQARRPRPAHRRARAAPRALSGSSRRTPSERLAVPARGAHRGGRRRPVWCSRRHRRRIMIAAAVVTAPPAVPARAVTRRRAATSRPTGRRGAAPARSAVEHPARARRARAAPPRRRAR